MELATVSSKGQITIPIAIRKELDLKSGSKVIFTKEGSRFYLNNSIAQVFEEAAKAFAGAAEKAGFKTEEELQAYAKEVREELWRDRQ